MFALSCILYACTVTWSSDPPLRPVAMADEEAPKSDALPTYPDMILEAIDALDDKNGANKTAISSFIEEKYKELPSAHASLLTANLASMKESGKLLFDKNNYVRPTSDAPAPPKRGRGRPPKPKDPNAPPPPAPPARDPNAPKRGRGRPPKPKDPNAPPPPPRAPKAKAPKRGRGRPPKTDKATSSPPAPRGRPAKKAKVAKELPAPSGAAPAKRGRGRPPKVRA